MISSGVSDRIVNAVWDALESGASRQELIDLVNAECDAADAHFERFAEHGEDQP